jgi:hypothetical protein
MYWAVSVLLLRLDDIELAAAGLDEAGPPGDLRYEGLKVLELVLRLTFYLFCECNGTGIGTGTGTFSVIVLKVCIC